MDLAQLYMRRVPNEAEITFVRVDLHNGRDDIHFGEFTFTPGAGLTNFPDRRFDRWLLRQLRRGRPPSKIFPSAASV